MKLAIRVDLSSEIGLGHFMRCLALAEVIHRKHEVEFWVARGVTEAKSRSRGIPVRELPKARGEEMNFIEQESASLDWIVVDGYHFDSELIRGFCCKILLLDDGGEHGKCECDLVLNQNQGASRELYRWLPSDRCLLGKDYLLLRSEFIDTQATGGNGILVSVGGGDHEGALCRILAALKECSLVGGAVLHLVVGTTMDEGKLPDDFPTEWQVKVHRDVENMAELMRGMKIAVTAGGSTCWELARMGIPSIVLALAENQLIVGRAVEEEGMGMFVGDLDDDWEKPLIDRVERVWNDESLRCRMSLKGRSLVDGLGTQRVLQKLEAYHADN